MKQIFKWLVLLALFVLNQSIPQLTVYPSVNTINQLATYVFTLNIGDSPTLPGIATLTFDSTVYSFTNTTGITGCYDSTNSSILYNCYASSASSISFSWIVNMSIQVFLSINNIKNPYYVSNFNVALSFSTGSFSPVSGTINSLQPGSLATCSMAYAPSYANSYSAVTFSLVNSNRIPIGGSLQLTFAGFTPASTPANLAISPSPGAASYINTSALTSSVGVFYAFSNFFKSEVPASTPLTFTLSSFLNPPTTSTANYSITVLTYASTSYQNKIDEKICMISGITDYPTPSLTVQTNGALRVGNISATLVVDFKPFTLINFATDTISVQVAASSTAYLNVYCTSVAVSTSVTGGTALVCGNNSNGVTFPTSALSTTIAADTSVSITSGIFLNSVLNSGAKSITVQFFRNGSSYSSNTATITVQPNILTNASFKAVSTQVLTSTTYQFTLQTKNPLGVGAVVVVTLPANITISGGPCSVTAALSASSSLSTLVGCSASGQSITVSNISTTVLPGNTTIVLNVSGISNPATTKITGSIFYQTFYRSNETGNPVDDSSGFSLTLTPTVATIPNNSFNVSRADQTNLKYTAYTFSYKVYTSFPANGVINILMPSYLQLSAGATASYIISTLGVNQSVPVTSSSNSSYTKLALAFTTAAVPANAVFTIVVNNILNYYSYKPINMQLLTYTSDSYAVELSNPSATTLFNTAPDTALLAYDSNNNTINGNAIAYLFSIQTTSLLSSSDLISVELQLTNNSDTQLAYSSSVGCKVNAVAVGCSKDLTNSRLLYVTVGSLFGANTVISLSISSIVLSRCQQQPGSVTVNTYEVAGSNYLISTKTFSPNANLQPNLINNAKLTINDNGISSPRLNVATSFTLSFQPTNLLTAGDYIVISVPSADWTFKTAPILLTNLSAIGSMNGSLCTDSNVFCSNYNNDSYKIRVDDKTGTAFPSISTISFTLGTSVYASSKTWSSAYANLAFITYTKNNFTIDSSANSTTNTAAFRLACPNTTSFHCKTCNSLGFCLSCYQLGDGLDTTVDYGGYKLRQSTGECVAACGDSYYISSNFCYLCTAPCYSCTDGSTTSCKSCIAPTVKVNTTCKASCDSGFYNSSGVCLPCSSPCATCVTTFSTCLSCNSGNYLFGNTCIASCAISGYFPDNATWVCKKCSVNCSDCSGSAGNCTTCAPDYFEQSPGVCTQSCPSGTVKVNSTLCSCNYTACKTCALSTNTCTSCSNLTLLLGTSCVTSCGNGYYASNSTCIACTGGCSICNASTCSVCGSGSKYLYFGLCYAVCPSGTTGSDNTCIGCPSGCSVCSSSTVCTTCQSIYYLVVSSDLSSSCVSSCAAPVPYVQSGKCVASCTPPSILESGFCVSNSGNDTNSTSTISSSKFIPVPVTLGLVVLSCVTLASKLSFQSTIVWAALSAFGGLSESVAWLILILVASADSTANSLSKIGMIIVLAAQVITLVFNCIAFYFFKKYIWPDDKFQSHKRRLKKTKCGLCTSYFCIILSLVFSHKWLDLLFSNLFETNHCVYKVSIVNKLTPINYMRYASIFASCLAIAGAAAAGYDTQAYKTNSATFMQSIDLIIVTIVSCIFSIAASKRNPEDYEHTNGLKRNDMEEHFEQDPVEDDINQFQKEEKNGNNRNKYKYSSSIRNTDPKENPLSKRHPHYKNPIGEENNLTNAPLDNHQYDNNRINLNEVTGMSIGNYKTMRRQGLDVEEIDFIEESGDSLIPSKSNKMRKNFSNRYGGAQSERLRRQAKEKKVEEKQKLKDNIESKLNEQEREKAKVVGQVDAIDTGLLVPDNLGESENKLNQMSLQQRKKEKLDAIQTLSEDSLRKLTEREREKAGEIRQAISLLKAKKIAIDDYLQYLDIIEEEDEEKKSDDYQNKKLASKLKNKKSDQSSQKKNLVKSLRKNERIQRSARYQKNGKIFVQYQDDRRGRRASFDQEKEPQQTDFHQTPIKGRNQSEQFQPGELQELRLSAIRSSNNRSEQLFKKKDIMHGKLLASLESADHDDPSLNDQFLRGNTLKQVQKDDLPPSNLYSTQIVPQKGVLQVNPKNKAHRIGPNRLLSDDDHVQYIEIQGGDFQMSKEQLLGFDNEIEPSKFREPSHRIQKEKESSTPTKPRIPKASKQGIMEVEDLQGGYDQFQNQQYDQVEPNQLQRYQSDRNLDYNEILMQKKRNEKQKQLEKIYLPRLDATRANKKKKAPKNSNTQRSQK